MTHLGLFEGIGGFSLAARWMGWETLAWCEWNQFGQRVLRHHFPNAEGFGDITKTDFTKYANRIGILTGGFPCQPYSMAGKRLGKEDDRHLWPEMLRAIREIQPRWVVGENVLGLVNWNGGLVFNEVQADLEAQGYEVQPYVLPACAVNAPHRRDRVWFVAYAKNNLYSGEYKFRKGNDISKRSLYECEKKRRHEVWAIIERFDEKHDASDTDSIRLEQCENRTEMGGGQGKVGGEGSQPSNAIETNGEVSNASDTESQSGKWMRPEFGEFSKSQQREFGGTYSQMGNDASDTDGIRFRREGDRIGKSKLIDQASKINDWSNFPTQSPICSRNDGISTGLDGITFSKWRNESIKAAGNAIVPQVALQIFKAIAQYEHS